MRVHDAIKNFNIGIDTIAEFLSSKGMPLEERNVNLRLRDKQYSLLYNEFNKPAPTIILKEKPEVQAIIDEIHQKKGKNTKKKSIKGTTVSTKTKKELRREKELCILKGQKIKVKINGLVDGIFYTKGFETLFAEGRVYLNDVYYNGYQLADCWSEYFLRSIRSKTEFIVIDPEVKADESKNSFAHLKYCVTPDSSWVEQFKQLKCGKILNGNVIGFIDELYIVQCSLESKYFVWGYVSKDEYFSEYDENSAIKVTLKAKGSNLFAPVNFVGTESLGLDNEKTVNTSHTVQKMISSSLDEIDFVVWRERQKEQLEAQRDQLENAYLSNVQPCSVGKTQDSVNIHNQDVEFQTCDGSYKKEAEQVIAEDYTCDANFFEDYKAKNKRISDFIYNDKSVTFDEYLQSTGFIIVRYKLLIALADLICEYHRANLIMGDIDTSNFIVKSDEPLLLKMIEDGLVNYKTNMIHMQDGLHYLAPEVKNHLSPITPMSECYSFALLVIHLLTGEEYQGKGEFGASPYLPQIMVDFLCQSLDTDPMLRPKLGKWCLALREGLDSLIYCNQCHQWYAPKQAYDCNLCHNKAKLAISLQIGLYGETEVYNVEKNSMEPKTQIIGKTKGNVVISESTAKVLLGYGFGISVSKDSAIAVITITQCNSNNDITLHIIPIAGNRFTLLDEDYHSKGKSFSKATDIEIKGGDLYKTMFLVESKIINNKILKICHI